MSEGGLQYRSSSLPTPLPLHWSRQLMVTSLLKRMRLISEKVFIASERQYAQYLFLRSYIRKCTEQSKIKNLNRKKLRAGRTSGGPRNNRVADDLRLRLWAEQFQVQCQRQALLWVSPLAAEMPAAERYASRSGCPRHVRGLGPPVTVGKDCKITAARSPSHASPPAPLPAAHTQTHTPGTTAHPASDSDMAGPLQLVPGRQSRPGVADPGRADRVWPRPPRPSGRVMQLSAGPHWLSR
jgi:hypothetical protein